MNSYLKPGARYATTSRGRDRPAYALFLDGLLFAFALPLDTVMIASKDEMSLDWSCASSYHFNLLDVLVFGWTLSWNVWSTAAMDIYNLSCNNDRRGTPLAVFKQACTQAVRWRWSLIADLARQRPLRPSRMSEQSTLKFILFWSRSSTFSR